MAGTGDGGMVRRPRARRSRTRLDPEVRREMIVSAAEEVFADRNPADVTLEQIAAAAGVSRGLVYNYFGDKGGVVAALYLRSFERLDGELLAALEPPASDAERLRAVVACYLRFARDHVQAWRLVSSAQALGHPTVQEARRVRFDRMAEAWGGTAEARILARSVVGLLEAATLDWLELEDVSVERATDLLHTLLWNGVVGLGPALGVGFGPGRRVDALAIVPREVVAGDSHSLRRAR